MKATTQKLTQSTKKRMAATCFLLPLFYPAPSFSETKGFVISFFHTATHKDTQSCTQVYRHSDLLNRSYKKFFSKEERVDIASNPLNCLAELTVAATRGEINGKLANVYHYPESATDAGFETYSGPYAYGFNLDGTDSGNDFRDPETGAKGVDNQLFRAIGCFPNYNIDLPNRPRNEDVYWRLLTSGRHYGAWLFTITAEDLSRDGEATVSFYRAIGDLRKDVSGSALADVTYIIDPDPRSYGEFKGTINNGVFTSGADGATLQLTGANKFLPQMTLSGARLRLKLNADRTATGYIGGYRPWKSYWHNTAMSNEANSADVAALYHNLKQLADAEPDPETGENRAISATFRIESVPAFVARSDGTVIADTR